MGNDRLLQASKRSSSVISDPYSQDIKLTPFTTPTFEIYYRVWNQRVGRNSESVGTWQQFAGL